MNYWERKKLAESERKLIGIIHKLYENNENDELYISWKSGVIYGHELMKLK